MSKITTETLIRLIEMISTAEDAEDTAFLGRINGIYTDLGHREEIAGVFYTPFRSD